MNADAGTRGLSGPDDGVATPPRAALFAHEPHERFGNSCCHAGHKLVLAGGEIELIARFAALPLRD